ncbi:MAG: hypothetical protein H0U67_08470 [Gemmatimonadetes bacterium]|nr:hypothetical protein [Gemmatimonadota bacterium]
MKRIYGVTLLVALAAAPLALEAQTRGTADPAVRDGQPFAMILGQRAALGLTDAQVTRLQAIGQRLQEQNAPLLEQMRASGAAQGASSSGQRQPMMQRAPAEQRDSMRARMQRDQQNMTPEQRQQMRERMRNMTPEQRAAMRSQMQDRRAGARGEGGSRGARQVPEELRPVMEQLRANQQAAMQEAQAVLTPEQQTRFRELAQQRRGQMGERMNRRPAGR